MSVLVVVGEWLMEILRQSDRWCSGSTVETRLPGDKSHMDSRSEVSGSEV